MRITTLAIASLFLLGCPSRTPTAGPTGDGHPSTTPGTTAEPARVPAVPSDHPLYARVEGEGHQNDCTSDADCKVTGCGGEVCSAEDNVQTTCEIQEWPQKGASCGCVNKECLWYRHAGSEPPAHELPGQGKPCSSEGCAEGLSCVEYYGIAGPSGPKLSSCEISCVVGKGGCPDGQTCVRIADGPGEVCRPQK